ncbi:MAG TPA: hypothetical protein VGS61_06105, partial [Acidimicrobiales bacterium]|nr:hypothetical protein [Acidimicrobiales bacterium]
IGVSQRSTITYWFFGSGSLALRWTPMLFVQDMLGGNGLIGARYFVGYNLPEVTGYVGLAALVATAAFVARLTRRGWVGECRDYVVFVVVGAVGLVATWGTFTPLGHVFRLIPLFGHTRLQSRNVILVDLAGALMLAWWLDRIEARDLAGASLVGGRRWFTLWPAAFAGLLSLALVVDGVPIVRFLGATAASAHLVHSEWLSLTLHLALAAALIALVLSLTRPRARRWLVGFVLADLLIFLVFNSTGLVGGHTIEPARASAVAALGDRGRTALVDLSGANGRAYEALGESNMNVFTRLPSVQGYGSLISTIYDNATGTHPQTTLNPCALRRGTFGPLRLAAIAVAQGRLVSEPGNHAAAPDRCLDAARTTVTNRYFGAVLRVNSVKLSNTTGGLTTGPLTIELLSGTGRVVARVSANAGFTHTILAVAESSFNGVRAGGLRVVTPAGGVIARASVTTSSGATYALNSPFELALASPDWRLSSSAGGYQVFRATSVAPPAWLVGEGVASRVTSVRTATWGDSWVGVDAVGGPVTLVRSMAYLPGWRATATDAAHRSVDLTVDRHGLVQSVRVPPGQWTVHFHYHAPHIEVGLAVSAGAAVLWLAAAAVLWSRARRRSPVSI